MRTWVGFLLIVASVAVAAYAATEATAKRWGGVHVITCSNITAGAGERAIAIQCGRHVFAMRRAGLWAPEFRRLSDDEIRELYLDRAFECSYAFEVVDYWYAPPTIAERFSDCHQKQPPESKLRLRRFS